MLGVEALRKRVRGGNVAIGCGAWADRGVAVVDGDPAAAAAAVHRRAGVT